MKIYQLTSENLSGLGGRMGTETTSNNWIKPFETLEVAMAFAENDYEGGKEIKWTKGANGWHSQDLSYVMYYIHEVELGRAKDIMPKMLKDDKIDLSGLKKVVAEYMDDIHSGKPSPDDGDSRQFIYEECLKTLYGKNIFDHINKIMR